MIGAVILTFSLLFYMGQTFAGVMKSWGYTIVYFIVVIGAIKLKKKG